MTRVLSARLAGLFLLLSGAAVGQHRVSLQNFDEAVLVGPVPSTSQVVGGVPVPVSGGVRVQFTIGYQIVRTAAGTLWIDFTTGSTFANSSTTGSLAVSHNDSFITSGIRFQVNPFSRLAFYGVAGGGAGKFASDEVEALTSKVISRTNYHGVLDVGGGVDLRITRPFSLRFEARDFISEKGLSGVSGRNHVVFLTGVAVHF